MPQTETRMVSKVTLMKRFRRYGLLSTAVLAMTFLAFSVGQCLGPRASTQRSLDTWDIPELVDHLNRAGLHVQLHSPRKDGLIIHNAFLTTTQKEWDELNRLGINPGPSRVQEWCGIVCCERAGERELEHAHWEGHYLVVGPFTFYGDAELLGRIRAILAPSAAP